MPFVGLRKRTQGRRIRHDLLDTMNSSEPATRILKKPERATSRIRTSHSKQSQRKGTPGSNSAGKARMGPEGEHTSAHFVFYSCPTLTLVCLPTGVLAGHSLFDAARHTGVHPEMIRYYCRLSLLSPNFDQITGEPVFDKEDLEEICRIEHYRRNLGVSRRALPLICKLRRECESLQLEVSFLRLP